MKITVEAREHFSKFRFYPACKNSEIFARLMDRKSFTAEQVAKMMQLGFDVEEIQRPKLPQLIDNLQSV